jgi:membrane-bound acyltransferase YfiQ involved in biofilm formation
LQAYFLGEVGNVRDTPFTPRLDLMFVQKLSGIVFFCSLLHLFGKFAESPLALVANMSFSIYFLHPIIALAIGAASRGEPVRTGNLYIDLALYSVLVFGLSLAAGSFVKRGLRERSRLVIGS